MIQVTARDALQALKKFKRLAKQDLLASEHTEQPQFWRRQAESRRATYDALMALVEDKGVEAAHRWAVEKLAALPLFGSDGSANPGDDRTASPGDTGTRQALEMFLAMLGSEEEEVALPSA